MALLDVELLTSLDTPNQGVEGAVSLVEIQPTRSNDSRSSCKADCVSGLWNPSNPRLVLDIRGSESNAPTFGSTEGKRSYSEAITESESLIVFRFCAVSNAEAHKQESSEQRQY
jgi:hypothetical protein